VAEPDAIELVLDVALESTAEEGDAAFAERVLQRAVQMQRTDLPPGARRIYVSLVLTDDAGIAELNREFRGVDAPTDVLSFPQLEATGAVVAVPADAPLPLGDIVVSLQRAEAQAHEYGHARARELGFLLVHGLLHLLGYDHETPAEAATMQARQDAILHALGLHRDGAR
jgi:probable rRNA maturation factor